MTLEQLGEINWPSVPRLIVGHEVWHEAPAVVRNLAVQRVLIITSGTWPGCILQPLSESLEKCDVRVTLSNHQSSNVRDVDVDSAAATFREFHCDGLISLGGGSAHDTAKAVRVLLASGRTSIAGAQGRGRTQGFAQVPHIAINTTSGTGAEVSGSYVYTDTRSKSNPRKRFLIDELVVPTVAIDDPTLMCTQPSWLVAYSGIDALTHAIEACAARPGNALGKELAMCAAKEISGSLVRAVADPHDKDLMSRICVAQLMAGVAFSGVGLGLVHAVSHALSAHFDIHHGLGNAITLPHVLDYNREAADGSYAMMGSVLEVDDAEESVVGSARLVAGISSLLSRLGMPRTVREIPGLQYDTDSMEYVKRDIVNHIMEDPCVDTNPRPVCIGREIEEVVSAIIGI
jgi:alcohol dehydrogenase class IV